MFWVYMLRCADGSFYVGHTDHLESRFAQHRYGVFRSCFTFSRRPLTLVFSQAFPEREQALAVERQVKGWSRHKKEALIRGDWKEISRLARGRSRGSD